MKKIFTLVLVLTMCFSLVGSAFAAPKDKILDDNVFMNYFNPSKAVTLNYGPGEKVAVSISSNAHFADYAKEGFWFIWGGDKDLGSLVSAKQKDTGFAVIAPFFFDKYKSLTITVKSSNEYRNVTFTEPGTYFIDQFLLKNEQKGPSGGYHNINWVGFSLKGNEKEYGYLKVTTNIGEEYEKSTYQPVWQKEIQPVWQKTVQPVWQKEIQPVWQKTIQPVWQRETQEVRQITYQTYNVPAYEREITGQINSGVSYVNLDYGILGGKMSDGMTYLELNVWEVKEYGATSMIVESSSNDVWTSYFYNVDISGNELTVSLSSAVPNTGAYGIVVSTTPFSVKPQINYDCTSTCAVNIPEGVSTIYLFAHFKDIKRYGNYEKYLGLIHDPKRDKESDDLVRSDVVSDNWLRNDLASDRFLRDYVAKDDFLRDDIVLDELIHEDIISDNWLRDDFVSKETVVDKYDASFDIVVINKSNGETVYTGTLENNGEINVPNLLAGEYDLILSGSGIFETKTATVTVNGVTLVDFNSNIDGVPVRVDLEKKYDEPIKLAKIYLDSKILEKIYSNPITLVVIYDPDIVLGNIYDPDIILESKYLDSINLDPISLGYDARIYVN